MFDPTAKPNAQAPAPSVLPITIGGVSYTLALVTEDLLHPGDGQRCNGLTWPDRALIQVDARLAPDVRRKVLWHEIGHAFKAELDITDASHLPEEVFCELVALALTTMKPKLFLKLWLFATHKMHAHDVIMLPGCSNPIPVIRYRDCAAGAGPL